MRITVGQYYRTRDDEKMFTLAIAPSFLKMKHPLVGLFFSRENDSDVPDDDIHKWNRDGCYADTTHPMDIIALWKEPFNFDENSIGKKIVLRNGCIKLITGFNDGKILVGHDEYDAESGETNAIMKQDDDPFDIIQIYD